MSASGGLRSFERVSRGGCLGIFFCASIFSGWNVCLLAISGRDFRWRQTSSVNFSCLQLVACSPFGAGCVVSPPCGAFGVFPWGAAWGYFAVGRV